MKKATAFVAASAVSSLMGLLPADIAQAASTACTAGAASTPAVCSNISGGYLATPLNFTGSNGVLLEFENVAAGFGVCGAHIGGSQAYGLTTAGGSMEIKTGSADINTSQDASSGAGGCA